MFEFTATCTQLQVLDVSFSRTDHWNEGWGSRDENFNSRRKELPTSLRVFKTNLVMQDGVHEATKLEQLTYLQHAVCRQTPFSQVRFFGPLSRLQDFMSSKRTSKFEGKHALLRGYFLAVSVLTDNSYSGHGKFSIVYLIKACEVFILVPLIEKCICKLKSSCLMVFNYLPFKKKKYWPADDGGI